jgi:hypothetical protein
MQSADISRSGQQLYPAWPGKGLRPIVAAGVYYIPECGSRGWAALALLCAGAFPRLSIPIRSSPDSSANCLRRKLRRFNGLLWPTAVHLVLEKLRRQTTG